MGSAVAKKVRAENRGNCQPLPFLNARIHKMGVTKIIMGLMATAKPKRTLVTNTPGVWAPFTPGVIR
ncbi:MAG: hypothetical protein ACD_40C00160G0002 [uncultured bacterium]|nr:MAG: hypothetical protein ACD_40C00160G0002 [uncultured bacterium]